jgi:hypothetical protein
MSEATSGAPDLSVSFRKAKDSASRGRRAWCEWLERLNLGH